jgi:hypothetical protein
MIIKRKLFSSEIILRRPVIKLRDEYKTNNKKAEEQIEDLYEPQDDYYEENEEDYQEDFENNQ